MVRFSTRAVPELILSLRERELTRVPIGRLRTTIGRDPGCDLVIDNVGISRLHATIEAVGDSFVLRDCQSQNGITLNGEPCREGRLVHGDVIGLNKFLVKFSNETLEAPMNLEPAPESAKESRPRDVRRTMHVDPDTAQALVALAKKQIARQRAESTGQPLPPPAPSEAPPIVSKDEEEEEPFSEPPGALKKSVAVMVGVMLIGGALIAALILIIR